MSGAATPTPADTFVALRADGVHVIVDLSADRLPAIVHWGADLGDLNAGDVAAMVQAGMLPGDPDVVPEPLRVAVLPEHHAGWLGRPGISGSRDGRDWSPKFVTSVARLNGVLVPRGTPAQPALVAAGCAVLEVEADDLEARLHLVVRLALAQGGILRSQADIVNLAEESYQLDECLLAFPIPSVARELLDFAGFWARERVPQRRAFTVGAHVREARRGRTGHDAATILHAGVPGFTFGQGEVWGVHVGWSGNHTHVAERLASGEQILGGGELLLPGEIILAAGEVYSTPWLYGSYGCGLDAVARRFHRYLRSRPQHPSPDRPVTLNVWEAVYFDHRLEPLVELAEKAASIGVERFVLDDGWFSSRRDEFSGLGDWTVSSEVWPDGLHPLIDRVKELGMQFGLWFEPEMISPDSEAARAHPDWIMGAGTRSPLLARNQQVINLGNPDCYEFIRDSILALLAEYDISYIKWDHNRDLLDAGDRATGRPGIHRQTAAVYRLMDELKAAHPGLEIESCSSGGSRVDLGVLERTGRVWVSDCIDPHERQAMLRWTGQLLPPELMGSHIASATSHTTGRTHDLNFRAATAIFGHLGIEWDLRRASAVDLAELAEWIAFYKYQRELLANGDLVRIDFPDTSLCATGFVASDRTRALFSFATTESRDAALRGRIRFPGLAPQWRYQVSPVMIGRAPSGLRPPAWWGNPRKPCPDEAGVSDQPVLVRWTGVELPGSVLGGAGLLDAPVHPDHALLYEAIVVG